jgi:hypothetical protein
MAGFLKQAGAGNCCECAEQKSACAGCEKGGEVTLEFRRREGYASKCGFPHPFDKSSNVPRLFRAVAADVYIDYEVTDFDLAGGTGPVAMYNSNCTLTVVYPDPCYDPGTAASQWNSERITNFWSGRPLVTGNSEQRDIAGGGQTSVEPWVRTEKLHDCWDANEVFARTEPGQPVRYSPGTGTAISGVLTGRYDDVGDFAVFEVPPPSLKDVVNGVETWWRKNGALDAPVDGWGWGASQQLRTSDKRDIMAMRKAKGKSVVSLGNEYKTAELKETVRNSLITSDWSGKAECAREILNSTETTFQYREAQFRFV